MNKHFIPLLTLGCGLALGSCQKKEDGPAIALTGKRWMLEQVDGTSIMVSSYSHDFNSYLEFNAQGNGVSGLAACSTIKGGYALAGSQQLAITQLITTPGTCANLNVATNYLAALPQTQRYEIQANKLLLFDGVATGPRLIFRAAE